MCKISVHKFLRALLVFAFALGASRVQVAHAASLIVNSTADNLTAGDGFCTLREAITNANSDSDTTSGDCVAGTGNDRITFSVSGTITLASTLPAISDPAGLTIDGAAQSITISGNLMVQVMVANSAAVLMLQTLTIAHGRSGGSGGGIENNGTLTVTNIIFSTNFGGPGFSVAGGGGIWNTGTLTVINSTFSGNNADYAGGGIWNTGMLTVINSTFSHNGAVAGTGIENDGTLTVTNSTFSSNGALLFGGGIDNNGILMVTNSTFLGNSASSSGGGIYNTGALTVTDSNFSGNSATNGGGIRSGGTMTVIHGTVTNSTFSGNSAVTGGGIDNGTLSQLTVTNSTFFGNSANFGGSINGFVPVLLRNTIVANSPSSGNCSGSFTDGGGNLSYPDATCPGINADPMLGPLQDNGGPTQTMALQAGSAAIDAAVLANCPATDQRGVPRPQGAGCDIGAFESVIYNFRGFFPPVDNPPTFNIVNAGTRVPVKFSLGGNQGLNIFVAGYPTSVPIACPLSASLDEIEQILPLEVGSLSYDARTDTYNYKWRTDRAWAGTCRQLVIRLNDGTDHIAYFIFR